MWKFEIRGIINIIFVLLEYDNIPNFELYVYVCVCVKAHLSVEIPEFNEIIYIG